MAAEFCFKKSLAMHLKAIYRYFPFVLSAIIPPFIIWIAGRLVLTPEFFERSGIGTGGLAYQYALYYRMQQWTYLTSVLMLTLKFFSVSLILDTAAYFNDLRISFTTLLRIVMTAEFSFYAGAILKISWFRYADPEGDLFAWQEMQLLSLAQLMPRTGPIWGSLLHLVNLFEIGYWFLLARGISKGVAITFDEALKLVISFYLPALLLWWATVMFFQIIFTNVN